MRLEDQSEFLWESYPAEYTDLAVLVTDLGDVTAVIVLLSVLYWVTDRRNAALVASYAVVGLSVILLLKVGFAMPRPEVDILAREYDQYGFPSGHAFTSVVVYGGLLHAFEKYREPLYLAGTTLLIAAISLSRVVLGVHYLADIIVGTAVGLLFLFVMDRLVAPEPWRGYALGFLIAIPTILLTSGEATTLAFVGLGSGLGGFVATYRFESIPSLRSRQEAAVLVVCGLAYLVTVGVLESTLAGEQPLLVAGFNAALIGGILLAPVAVGRIEVDLLANPGGE